MSSENTPIMQLPVVDMSATALDNPETRKVEAQKIVDSFTDVGFCIIKGVDVDDEELFGQMKWFFHDVPKDLKMNQLATRAFNPDRANVFRGYFPDIEKSISYKEGYDIGMQLPEEDIEENNPFHERTPYLDMPERQNEVDKFYSVMNRYKDQITETSDKMMELIAEAGNEDSAYFKSLFKNGYMHVLRPIHYPKRNPERLHEVAKLGDGRVLSTGAHQDSGYLTLLKTFQYPGLEIQIDGQWYQVPCKKDEIIVNVGEQLKNMSNNRFKATIHRVVDIGADRYSMPFFYEPCADADINSKVPRSLLPPETQDDEKEPYYPYATFLFNKLPIYTEYAKIAEWLPETLKKRYLEGFKVKEFWAMKNSDVAVDNQEFVNSHRTTTAAMA